MASGQKHTIKKNSTYFITLTVIDWIDVFTRKNHKTAIVDSLKYCIKNKGLNIYAYCLMTNHLHMIVSCNEPFQLKDTIRDFKRHIVKQILSQIKNEPESRRNWIIRLLELNAENSAANEKIKFWKNGNHAIEIQSPKMTWRIINYIHNNPVMENFVINPEHWIYSSASNYINGTGIINEVICLKK